MKPIDSILTELIIQSKRRPQDVFICVIKDGACNQGMITAESMYVVKDKTQLLGVEVQRMIHEVTANAPSD